MHTGNISLCLNSLPRFVKTCPRCKSAYYENSGCFRVNANGKRLDIWLICRCEHCKAIWNLSIYERIDRSALSNEAYSRYLANDRAFVLRHVFDPAFLRKNRAELDLEDICLLASGDIPEEGQAAQLCVRCDHPLPIPLGRAIALVLGMSLSRVKRMQDEGMLLPEGDLRKTRAGSACSFTLTQGWQRNA